MNNKIERLDDLVIACFFASALTLFFGIFIPTLLIASGILFVMGVIFKLITLFIQ